MCNDMPACSSVIVLRAGIQSCKHMIVCVYVCIFILAWCIYVCVCVCVCACVRASTPSFSSFHVLLLPIRGSGCVRGGGDSHWAGMKGTEGETVLQR